MNKTQSGKSKKPKFKDKALFLQGGGALGSYEAGVCEALDEVGILSHISIVGGDSIGTINGAIVSSTAPEKRVNKLKQFWYETTHEIPRSTKAYTSKEHFWADAKSASHSASGVPGMATKRPRIKLLQAWQSYIYSDYGDFIPFAGKLENFLQLIFGAAPISYLDNKEQKALIERYVDFDALNSGKYVKRFAAGVTDAQTLKSVFFDTATHKLNAYHIMASAAIIPNMPMVEIEGRNYFDGCFSNNNPRSWAVNGGILDQNSLSIKVHLFSPHNETPRNVRQMAALVNRSTSADRGEDVPLSPHLRKEAKQLYDALMAMGKEGQLSEKLKILATGRESGHVIDVYYKAPPYALKTNSADFARSSMKARWNAGYENTMTALCRSGMLDRFDDEVVERLAPHIFRECPDVIKDLSPEVLKIICSKKVLQNPKNLRDYGIPPIDNEYMEIPEQRGINIQDAILSLFKPFDTITVADEAIAEKLRPVVKTLHCLIGAGLLDNVDPAFRSTLESRIRVITGEMPPDEKWREERALAHVARAIAERNKQRHDQRGTARTLF